jgi:hypothetical protein
VSKQPDVLMLFYLLSADELGDITGRLGYPFEYETIPKNIAYYERRTAHGSTLSHVVHSWVLARSDRTRAWQLFRQALESDVADVQGGTTQEGIHMGVMAGTPRRSWPPIGHRSCPDARSPTRTRPGERAAASARARHIRLRTIRRTRPCWARAWLPRRPGSARCREHRFPTPPRSPRPSAVE